MAIELKHGEVANGTISRNSRKEPGSRQPDFTGQIMTPMGYMRISVWAMVNQTTGESFLSFSVTEGNGAQKEVASAAAPASVAGMFDALFKAPESAKKTRRRKKGEPA